MLSIHYVSIMMWIFFIDWQQYWKCDWTMNIGANRNAHGKRTGAHEQYQQNSRKWKTWQLGFQTLERYWASFQVTRLFHSATIFSTRPITRMKSFSFFFFGGGCAQLQCIYYLVLYTDLKAAEGNYTFQKSLLYISWNKFSLIRVNVCFQFIARLCQPNERSLWEWRLWWETYQSRKKDAGNSGVSNSCLILTIFHYIYWFLCQWPDTPGVCL